MSSVYFFHEYDLKFYKICIIKLLKCRCHRSERIDVALRKFRLRHFLHLHRTHLHTSKSCRFICSLQDVVLLERPILNNFKLKVTFVFSIINSFSNPIETVKGVHGLVIWNSVAGAFLHYLLI